MNARIKAVSSLIAVAGMAEVLGRTDHVDVKSVVGHVSLRSFLAGWPWRLRLLYRVRGGLARLLGLRHGAPPDRVGFGPGDVPMTPGQNHSVFAVSAASEDRHWIAWAEDRHLRCWLCVLATPEIRGATGSMW
jgi:hypothetical protein